jgi:hypothetical protein
MVLLVMASEYSEVDSSPLLAAVVLYGISIAGSAGLGLD